MGGGIFGSDAGDIPRAKGIAKRLGVEDVQAFLHAKLGEAEALISANRVGVEAVHRAIVERRTLQGAEVRAILAG